MIGDSQQPRSLVDDTTAAKRAAKAAYMRQWVAKNPDKARANAKKSAAKRAAARAEYHKKWAAENREKLREYHREWSASSENKEKKKEWFQSNKEKIAASKRALYARNPAIKEYNQRWLDAHPEVRKAGKHNRRAAERRVPGKFTGAEFKALCEKYGNKCLCCGSTGKLSADHVIPISKGGSNLIENIQPLCMPCNAKKHVATVDYRNNS